MFKKLKLLSENQVAVDHVADDHAQQLTQILNACNRMIKWHVQHDGDNHFSIHFRGSVVPKCDVFKYAKRHNLAIRFVSEITDRIVINEISLSCLEALDSPLNYIVYIQLTDLSFTDDDMPHIDALVKQIVEMEFHLGFHCKNRKIDGGYVTKIHKLCMGHPNIEMISFTGKHMLDVQNLDQLVVRSHTPKIALFDDEGELDELLSDTINNYSETLNKNQFIDELIENNFKNLL